MEIRATHHYPQPPQDAFAMLTDPGFLEAVCLASDPLEFTTWVDGLRTGARRTMRNHPSIEKFTGPTITVTDEVTWQESAVDGVHTGATLVSVEGMPVALTGTVTLAASQTGSTLTYLGDLKVSIPLVGPVLERQAAPILLEALELQAKVAQGWR